MQTRLVFFLSALIMMSANAQQPPVVTDGKLHGILPLVAQQVTYREVIDCGSVTQVQVFQRARLWLAQAVTSQTPFTVCDKETGDLFTHSMLSITLPRSETSAGGVYTLGYGVTIECTNHKYRVTIAQIRLHDNGSTRPIPIETLSQKNDALYAELDKQLRRMLTELQTAVNENGFR